MRGYIPERRIQIRRRAWMWISRHFTHLHSGGHRDYVQHFGSYAMNPLLAPIFGLVGTVIDRLIPDKAAAEKAKLEMAGALQAQEFQIQIEQIRVNAEE